MASQTSLSTDALDLDYMRVLRSYLNTIAHWPHETFGPRTVRTRILTIYHRLIILTLSMQVISEIVLAKHNSKTHDLFYMGQDYLNSLIKFVMIARCTLMLQNKYCDLLYKFVTNFHLRKHEHVSEFAAKEHRWITKICRIVTLVIMVQSVIGPLMFNLVPIYQNFHAGMFSARAHRPENATFTHSINYYFILDQYKDTAGFIIVFIANLYYSYICAAVFCGLDLLVYIMLFHIMGHINILVDKMHNFPRPIHSPEQATEASTRQYNEQATKILKGFVENDIFIKECYLSEFNTSFLNDISGTFSLQVCICLFYHQVSGCICLLEISPMTPEALVKYVPLTIIMYNQLIQMSLVFELIASKSDSISDEVYALPWELLDNRNRKTVLVFLMNAQQSRSLKAGGLVPVGVLTMSSIIRNSLSYFIFLKTLGSN